MTVSPEAPLTLTPRQPFGPGTLDLLAGAVASGSLSSVGGPLTARLESELAAFYGSAHAITASSGTAAIHTAVAALCLEPGSEIVVAPITDAGSVVPVLYEGLVPVFCDVGDGLAMTRETVEAVLTPRTRAVMLVHLFGGVGDAAGIRSLADEHDLWLLEDCSQAHGTKLNDRYLGTFGHIGMFSMQQSKHMTTGDGGFCITGDDRLAREMRLFRDKGWDRGTAGVRAYPRLGLNYRITELQSAVALPQVATLRGVVDRRRYVAARLDAILEHVPGVTPWDPPARGKASYWCYPVFVAPAQRDAMAAALRERGVPATGGYIGAPIPECLTATATQRTFGSTSYPYNLAPQDFSYDGLRVPVARSALDRVVVLWLHEDLTDADVDAVGGALTDAASRSSGR